jgi:hypothetical protein
MKERLLLLLAGALFVPALLRAADSPQLSAARLDLLDERGYFTPAFKSATHDLVDAQQAVAQAKEDERKLRQSLPDLQKQNADLQARVVVQHKELALYEHPEDSDYEALQASMKNPALPPEQRMMMAQAFVWSYPTDPRQGEAEQDLQQIQRQLASHRQAARELEAAQAAAHARLLQRAGAHDLSLAEWQDFLRDMSQEDLVAQIGRPQSTGPDYWVYSGAWATDPTTKTKQGLLIHFNGTRVLEVTAAPQ